jgi:hypothetical protein
MAEQYEVLDPTITHFGKTYGEWASDFVSWYFSIDPDLHNNGPVVFLRGMPLPHPEGYSPGTTPNIMVGNNKLNIFSDQLVLIPVIFAYWASADPMVSEISLRERTRVDVYNGDFPPTEEQILVDKEPVNLGKNSDEERLMMDFLIDSPVFTLTIADSDSDLDVKYANSLKYSVEFGSLSTGDNRSVATGFFLLLRFKPGLHTVHSYARGRTTEKGPYNEEFLYEINVLDKDFRPSPSQLRILDPQSTLYLNKTLKEMVDKKELEEKRYNELISIVDQARARNKFSVVKASLAVKFAAGSINVADYNKLSTELERNKDGDISKIAKEISNM